MVMNHGVNSASQILEFITNSVNQSFNFFSYTLKENTLFFHFGTEWTPFPYLQEERLIASILFMTFTFSFVKKALYVCNISSQELEDAAPHRSAQLGEELSWRDELVGYLLAS